MKIPNERCEWLMKDKANGGGTTMQDYELAEDLLEARKQLSDLRTRLKKAMTEIRHAAKMMSYDDTVEANEVEKIMRDNGLVEEGK